MLTNEKEIAEFIIGDDGTFQIDIDETTGEITDLNNKENKSVEKKEKTEEKEEDKKEKSTEGKFIYNDENIDENIDEPIKEDNKDINTDEDNLYKVFANSLIENEILVGLNGDESIESEEDLVNLIAKTRDTLIDQTLEEINEKSYGAVDFFLNGGTIEEFTKKFANKDTSILTYKEEDIKDNEDIQRKIAEAFYKKTTKLKEDRIKKLVDNAIEVDGEDEIIDMFNQLKDLDKLEKEEFKEEVKRKEAQNIKQREEFNKQLKENTLNITEFIPGRKLEKKQKEKVFDNIPEILQKVNKDLSKYAPILSYLDYYGILDGKFDKIIKDVESKNTTKLSDVLSKTNFKKGSNTKIVDEESNDLSYWARKSLKKK